MTFRPSGRHDGPTGTDHREHEADFIAAHAAGDLPAPAAVIADRLIEGCRDCARLYEDLRAIARATHALPRLPAPRDFTLTPDQADRLGRGSGWRRLLRPLVARDGIGRPLATAFTTLGIVGLLLASLPGGMGQLATTAERDAHQLAVPSAPPPDVVGPTTDTGAGAVEGDVPTGASGDDDRPDEGMGNGAAGGPGGDVPTEQPKSGPEAAPDEAAPDEPTPPVGLVALSATFVAVGLALFAVRRRAGPRTD